MTIVEAAAQLREKKISSVELTKAALKTIEEQNPRLNAFITVTAEGALAQAAASDARRARKRDVGSLDGIPVALKDLFYTKGVRTTAGSLLYRDFVPDFDSAVTEKLQLAGAVMLGKTGMHELAYGVTSNNPHFGAVRNPHDPECIPGGSSGGSGAAVASGMCFMAMGSDTGGSIRIPAAFCGTVGLKPTYGRVSRFGAFPLGFSLDHMGPLTRSVEDAGIVLNALAGFDPRDDSTSHKPVADYAASGAKRLDGMRIGVPKNFYLDRVSPEMLAAYRHCVQAAAGLGAHVVEVRVPDIAALNTIARMILLAEASALMEPHLGNRANFGDDVLALFDQGRLVAGTDYVNAQRRRRIMQQEFNALFETIDCLFTPVTPTAAPRIGQTMIDINGESEDVRLATTRLVRGVNVLGLPALALPCGKDAAGMPLSLQIIGRAFEEETILAAGSALEAELCGTHSEHR
jgi:aspartyl-tRNA(Asn)/glutamyl-tRNA(Gln) amidotransferase subunit A